MIVWLEDQLHENLLHLVLHDLRQLLGHLLNIVYLLQKEFAQPLDQAAERTLLIPDDLIRVEDCQSFYPQEYDFSISMRHAQATKRIAVEFLRIITIPTKNGPTLLTKMMKQNSQLIWIHTRDRPKILTFLLLRTPRRRYNVWLLNSYA